MDGALIAHVMSRSNSPPALHVSVTRATGATHVSFVWLARQVNEMSSWKLRDTGHIPTSLSLSLSHLPGLLLLFNFLTICSIWNQKQNKTPLSNSLYFSTKLESLFFSSKAATTVSRSECARFQSQENEEFQLLRESFQSFP